MSRLSTADRTSPSTLVNQVHRALAQESADLEWQLTSSPARWLYLIGSHTNAIERVLELVGRGAHHLSTPGPGEVHWFMAYLSSKDVEKLRGDEAVEHVQAVPQTLKIEPFHLGAKLLTLQEYSPSSEPDLLLEQPEMLKVVLADGALASLEEAQSCAGVWEEALRGSATARDFTCTPEGDLACGAGAPVSCSAEDTDAVVCGPVLASRLQSSVDWLAGRPESLVVEIKKAFKPLNKWAKQVVQVRGVSKRSPLVYGVFFEDFVAPHLCAYLVVRSLF